MNVEWFEFESYHEMNPVCGVLYLVKCLSERLLSLSYKQKSKNVDCFFEILGFCSDYLCSYYRI